VAVFVVMVFPVFWMISTAFKTDEQIIGVNPTWFPLHPTLAHFRAAFDKPFFWVDVKNSLIVVLVTVAISIVLAFLAAVALARYDFGGRKLFVVLVIGIQMLPQAGLISAQNALSAAQAKLDQLQAGPTNVDATTAQNAVMDATSALRAAAADQSSSSNYSRS